MKQRIRRAILLVLLLLFPIVMNYISPYVPMAGASEGFITMSLIMFTVMFLTALVFGRAWCAWVCPVACLQEVSATVNPRTVNVKRLRVVRYIIFTVWALILVFLFIQAGGVKGIHPFFFTDNGISVDGPQKYVIYYSVLLILIVLNFTLGRRGACHAICWMSPFMTAGYHVGKALHIPQLRVTSVPLRCTSCNACTRKCQMSLPVRDMAKKGVVDASECILCGECIEACPKKVLSLSYQRKKRG